MEKHEHILANGFKVVLIPNHLRPIIEIRGWTRAGQACRSGNATLDARSWPAHLVPEMLTHGTHFHSADEFEDLLDDFAFHYAAEHSLKSSFFVEWSGKAIRPYETQLLRLIYESLHCPSFSEKELFIVKREEEADLLNSMNDVENCASAEGLRMLYKPPHHLYPLTVERSIEQLSLVTRDCLLTFWKKFYTPDRSGIVLVGDINPHIAFAQVEEIFGEWEGGDAFNGTADVDLTARDFYGEDGYEERTVFLPGKANAVVCVLKRMEIASDHPDYAALRIAVSILGGDSHSRLFVNVRRKCGSYNTGALLYQMHVTPGCLLVFAHNPPGKIHATQEEIFRVLADFYEHGINDNDLSLEKTIHRSRLAQSRSNFGGIAGEQVTNYIAGNPNHIEELAMRVANLSVKDVNCAIGKYLDPSDVKAVRAGTFVP